MGVWQDRHRAGVDGLVRFLGEQTVDALTVVQQRHGFEYSDVGEVFAEKIQTD